MIPKIVTIGVYGFEEEHFFRALQDAGVEAFCDIRQRRGVRGSHYAFANSQRLQQRLAEMGIRYLHRKDLAPNKAIRQQQKAADEASGTKKRERSRLSPAFIRAYQSEILSDFDAWAFLDEIGPEAAVVALFCVEREPAACHRALLAGHLAQELGLVVEHIEP